MRLGLGMGLALPRLAGALPPGTPKTYTFTDGVMASGATLTRATTGTYFDNAGALQVAAIDTARFDHAFNVGTYLGLLVEPERTNLVRNSAGGPTGTAEPDHWNITSLANGVVAWNVVASTLFNGANEVEFQVTNNDVGNENINAYTDDSVFEPVLEGQVFAGSLFHRDPNNDTIGSTQLAFHGYHNTNGYQDQIGAHVVLNATDAWQWDTEIRTQIAGADEVQMRPQVHDIPPAGTTVKEFALPQFELGGFKTSPIITTGVPVTRSADVLHLDLVKGLYDIAVDTPEGTFTSLGVKVSSDSGWDFVWPDAAIAAGSRHITEIRATAPA